MKRHRITSGLAAFNVWMRNHRARAATLLAAAGLAAVVISCGSFSGILLAPPQIPGATFIGSQGCADCHQEIFKKFKTSDHARLMARGDNAKDIGCESCHGPGSLHSQSGGALHTIVNPKKDPETCFQCHLEKRGNFSLPYHHPLEDGKVGCGDCHDPHEGRVVKGGSTSQAAANETCFKCHSAQRGPFIFEHEAVREGCVTCHNPHGSVNPKMLVARNQELCLRCHFQQQLNPSTLLIGNVNHAAFVSRGTCWSAGCHEAIHGSQVNSHIRF